MHFHSIPHKHVRVQQKDHNLKNEKFTYNFSLPKTSNNTLRKSAVSLCCVDFVSTSIDLMWKQVYCKHWCDWTHFVTIYIRYGHKQEDINFFSYNG